MGLFCGGQWDYGTALRTAHCAPRSTHHAPRTTQHAARSTHHAARSTHHAPRTTHHAPGAPCPPPSCGGAYLRRKSQAGACLLLDGTMGRMGRMGRMIMGQWDNGTVLWGTMELWDSTTHCALRTAHHIPRTTHHAQRTTHCASGALCTLFGQARLFDYLGAAFRNSRGLAVCIPRILVSCQSSFRPQDGHCPDRHWVFNFNTEYRRGFSPFLRMRQKIGAGHETPLF
jgi:hypothetical protein